MSNRDFYTLKYDIKQALESKDSKLSKTDKDALRQTQREVMWMTRALYVYMALDVVFSSLYIQRNYAQNYHMVQKMIPKMVGFATLRITGLYYLNDYMGVQHLQKRARPILLRQQQNERKTNLLDNIDKF